MYVGVQLGCKIVPRTEDFFHGPRTPNFIQGQFGHVVVLGGGWQGQGMQGSGLALQQCSSGWAGTTHQGDACPPKVHHGGAMGMWHHHGVPRARVVQGAWWLMALVHVACRLAAEGRRGRVANSHHQLLPGGSMGQWAPPCTDGSPWARKNQWYCNLSLSWKYDRVRAVYGWPRA